MWSENFEKWMFVVVQHYGSFLAFNDAPTIRIHLGTARREIIELNAFLDSVEGKLPASETQPWTHELIKVKNIESDLLFWLSSKGLPE